MPMMVKTFSITPNTLELIKELSRRFGISESKVVRIAVKMAYEEQNLFREYVKAELEGRI